MPSTITIAIYRPSLRYRIRWYLIHAKLHALKPISHVMTAEEWYAADCPPYAGQRAPWKLP